MSEDEFRDFADPYENQVRYSFDERGLSYLYADSLKMSLRYVCDIGKPFHYGAGKWQEDVGYVFSRKYAKDFVSFLKDKVSDQEKKKCVDMLLNRSKRETIIKDAQDVHPVTMRNFDANPHLLNCLNGTYDLETDQFRNHQPLDFLSKQANVNYVPGAKNERWTKFINEIMCGDTDLAHYLQKILGYCLSGATSEECLFIAYGPTTRNGKGTLMESIGNVLGDYARTMQPASLAQRKASGSGHSADIARLAGIRFVNASELPSDMKLDAAIVKQITGGDTVTTRLLYQNFFEYKPQFKVFINTNHLPEIEDDTLFSSGRLRLIPFDRHFDEAEQDHSLKHEFRKDEGKSAILNWLLEGYALYMKEGLIPPKRAEDLLLEYCKNNDRVGLYIKHRLESCDEKQEKQRRW